jgi:hypothetical protein
MFDCVQFSRDLSAHVIFKVLESRGGTSHFFGKQFSFDFQGSLILLRFHRRGLKEESLDTGVHHLITPSFVLSVDNGGEGCPSVECGQMCRAVSNSRASEGG